MLDFVILTEDRYERPLKKDWYIKNIIKEDLLLMEALRNLGFSVDRVSWSSKDFEWSSVRFVVFRSTWDYFERLSEFRNWLDFASKKTTFINTYPQILWNLDKSYLSFFSQKGINIVPSFFVKKKTSLVEIMNKFCWDEVVIKPVFSAAAWNTYRVSPKNLTKLEPVFLSLQKNKKMIVQEFQKSVLSFGEVSMVLIGGRVTHSVIKKVKKGDYRVQDDYGGTVGLYKASEKEVRFAELVVSMCSPIPAYARVDVIVDNNNKLALSEIELIEPELWFRFNPRAADLLAKEIQKKTN